MSSRRAEKKIGHSAEFLFVGNFFKELIVTVGDLFHYDKRVAVLKAFSSGSSYTGSMAT